MADKKEINETLKRFNKIMGYDSSKGLISERKSRTIYQDYADEDESEFDFGDEDKEGDEGNADFDFGDEGSPEGGEDSDTGEDFGDDTGFGGDFGDDEEEVDEFGTAGEFSAADDIEDADSDIEEIDVTAIVAKSDEAKEAAQQAVSSSQENSQYLKAMTDKLENLSNQLGKMDTIVNRISKIENSIKTPEEKLELRSLDSYPFNLKLTDYWQEKAAQDDNYKITTGEETVDGKTKEYTITKDEVEDYNETEIENSFNPEADIDAKVWKRQSY